MILLRGIRGEAYARKIRQGIVDCRDVLSTLLDPPVTGYAYTDYYEKNLVNNRTYSLYYVSEKENKIENINKIINILIYINLFGVLKQLCAKNKDDKLHKEFMRKDAH